MQMHTTKEHLYTMEFVEIGNYVAHNSEVVREDVCNNGTSRSNLAQDGEVKWWMHNWRFIATKQLAIHTSEADEKAIHDGKAFGNSTYLVAIK